MDFGKAIEALKEGKLVAREGWNGKGMFVFMQGGYVTGCDNLPVQAEKWFRAHTACTGPCPNVETKPYLSMKAADNTIVNGWLASQTDMLAEDWVIVEPPMEG